MDRNQDNNRMSIASENDSNAPKKTNDIDQKINDMKISSKFNEVIFSINFVSNTNDEEAKKTIFFIFIECDAKISRH